VYDMAGIASFQQSGLNIDWWSCVRNFLGDADGSVAVISQPAIERLTMSLMTSPRRIAVEGKYRCRSAATGTVRE